MMPAHHHAIAGAAPVPAARIPGTHPDALFFPPNPSARELP